MARGSMLVSGILLQIAYWFTLPISAHSFRPGYHGKAACRGGYLAVSDHQNFASHQSGKSDPETPFTRSMPFVTLFDRKLP